MDASVEHCLVDVLQYLHVLLPTSAVTNAESGRQAMQLEAEEQVRQYWQSAHMLSQSQQLENRPQE